MKTAITKEMKPSNFLKEHNKEPFHILHGLTVGAVLRWYAERARLRRRQRISGRCAGFSTTSILRMYPGRALHRRRRRLLEEAGAEEELIHAIVQPRLRAPGGG